MAGQGKLITTGRPAPAGASFVRVIPNTNIATPISLPSYSTLTDTAASPSERQLTLAAANAPLRYTYGLDRIAPLLVNALLDSAGAMLLDCVIGEGPIGGVVSTEINDAALPAGVTVTVYDGTQTTADSALVAAWLLQGVVYADIRPGVAYAVIKIPASVDVSIDERSIAFAVQGLLCWDPRQNLMRYSEAFDNAVYYDVATVTPGSATPPFGCQRADTLTDSSAVAFQSRAQLFTIPNDSATYVVTVRIKKTAGGTSTTFGFLASLIDGGTPVSKTARINTDLGASLNGFVTSIESTVDGAYWLATITLTNNATGNVRLNVNLYPATNTYNNASDVVATTGSAIVSGLQVSMSPGAPYTRTTSAAINPVTAYTTNPALILANFLAHPTRGPGDTLDWNSVGVVAERCDQLLATKKRHTFGLTFSQQVPKKDIEETLRAGVCFVVREGPTTYLVADAPVDVSGTLSFAAADWQPRELRYSQRDAASAPNRITVRYTNTAVKPWGEAYTESVETADVTAGLVDAVEMVVNATWIQDYAEAIRLRNRYFAEHTLGLKTLDFPVFEKGYKVRRGDVIQLTNGVDLTAKPVRVQRLTALGFARVKITAQEYQPAMYSDDTPGSPTYPSTGLPSPLVVLPVTGLTMVEEVYLDQLQTAGVASGAKYVSRFRVTWTRSLDRYLVDNVLKFMNGTQLVFEGPSTGTEYASPPVQQGQSYTVEVRARNTLGFLSPVANKSAVAQGKLLPPGDVPRISQAIELGGEVLLAWDPSIDIDVIRYEWRYTPNSVSGSWESATLIDRVDGLRTRFKGLPVGTHRFYVKAIDSVPQYSVNAVSVDITVTSDANAFLQTLQFTSISFLASARTYQIEGEKYLRTITNWPGSWNSNFTAAMSTYTNPVATYGYSAGVSIYAGEVYDIGALVTGTWALTIADVALGGAITRGISTSPDNVTYTDRVGLSYVGAARYVKPYAQVTGAGTGMHITTSPAITLAAVSRKESGGPVTSSAGAASTINLTGKYAKAVRITITPLGTVARTSTLNNVVLSTTGANSFDVYLFDRAGTQVASDYNWDFEGF